MHPLPKFSFDAIPHSAQIPFVAVVSRQANRLNNNHPIYQTNPTRPYAADLLQPVPNN